jgi:hypothetical protein
MTTEKEKEVQETAERFAKQHGVAQARILVGHKISDAIAQRDAEMISFWRDVLSEIKL